MRTDVSDATWLGILVLVFFGGIPFSASYGLVWWLGGVGPIVGASAVLLLISIGLQWWISTAKRWQMFPVWTFSAIVWLSVGLGALAAHYG